MLSRADISAQTAVTLTAEQAALLETYFRFWEGYNPSKYPNLSTKLGNYVPTTTPDPLTTGDIYRVKMLLATLVKLEALGSSTVKIRSAAGTSLDSDKERDRYRLIEFAMMVLFDRPPTANGIISVPLVGLGVTPVDPSLIPNQNTESGWPYWDGCEWWYYRLP